MEQSETQIGSWAKKLGPLTEAEEIEFTELSIRYNFVGGPAIKAWRDLKEKERAEAGRTLQIRTAGAAEEGGRCCAVKVCG